MRRTGVEIGRDTATAKDDTTTTAAPPRRRRPFVSATGILAPCGRRHQSHASLSHLPLPLLLAIMVTYTHRQPTPTKKYPIADARPSIAHNLYAEVMRAHIYGRCIRIYAAMMLRSTTILQMIMRAAPAHTSIHNACVV